MRYVKGQTSISFNTPSQLFSKGELTAGEFFAGGGGWTHGLHKVPGVKTRWILNHDKVAISTNAFHHPDAKVYIADIYAQDEHDLEPVDCIHASIECQQHSRANSNKTKKLGSYTMGWELYRYIKYLKPLILTIENVVEFKKWAPVDENDEPIAERTGEEFERWKKAFIDLGYEYKESIRDAADDGMPTRRERYFGVFFHPSIDFKFPCFTHSKKAKMGKSKWVACGPYLDLDDEGISIFGRKFNEKLPKQHRRELCDNTLKRIAYGAMKYSDHFRFIAQYYGGDPNRFQSLDDPLYTITCENRHQLITMEKIKFIMDYCRSDIFHGVDEPLRPQLTRQTKQIVSVENYICQYYGKMQAQSLETPLNGVNCTDRHQLIRIEKVQFLAKYFNSSGNPGPNVQSINSPLSAVMTNNKHQLITILDGFDIKARFLRPDELAACSTFPRDYFKRPGLRVSRKNAVKMIGNAVPPDWAKVILGPNIREIQSAKEILERNKLTS